MTAFSTKTLVNGVKVVRVLTEDGVWLYVSDAGPKHRLTRFKLIRTDVRYFDYYGHLRMAGHFEVPCKGNRARVISNGDLWEDWDE